MTENLPNYAELEPPDGKPLEEYTTHERRAEVLQLLRAAGSPFAISQTQIAERFGVHRSTISRDMKRLRESVADHLGTDAKITTRVLFEKTVRELQNEGEWKAAWSVVMDWNQWLADLGEQYREPTKSQAEVNLRSRHSEVAYHVVREPDRTEEPAAATEDVDPEEIGFTSAPAAIEIEGPADG